MNWLYLRAASPDALKDSRSGAEPSPTARLMNSDSTCWRPEWIAAKSCVRQSGRMSERSRDRTYLKSTSSQAPSRVRTSRLQDAEKAWKGSEAAFFGKLSDWPTKQRRLLSSLKTSGQAFGPTFPPSDLLLRNLDIHAGTVIFQLRTAVQDIDENGGFCLVPTPTASSYGYNRSSRTGKIRPSLKTIWKNGTIPTPIAGEGTRGGSSRPHGQFQPTVSDPWKQGMIPTPTAREWRNEGLKSGIARNSPSLSTLWKATIGTNAPPSFFEWIQGYRIGASALEHWAIAAHQYNTRRRLKGF